MLSLVTLFLLVCPTYTRLVNLTIDDFHGDPTQDMIPSYQGFASLGDPEFISNNCSAGIDCSIQPNMSLAFDKTWSTVMYNAQPGATANVTFYFQGSRFPSDPLVLFHPFFIRAGLFTGISVQ